MSILAPEIPDVFGALDSTALADGDLPSSHALRAILRSADRQLATGEPLFNHAFDIGGAATETPIGSVSGWGWLRWTQIFPGPVTRVKKPGLTRAKLNAYVYARSGDKLFIQVVTRGAPFEAIADGTTVNTLEITGTGSFGWFSKDDLPIAYDATEETTILLRGAPTSNLGNTATYGGVNAGAINEIRGSDILHDSGAGWNTTGATWDSGGHCVVIESSITGIPIAEPRWIVGVPEDDELRVFPEFGEFERQSLAGHNYRILELARWRLGSISLYAKDRTA